MATTTKLLSILLFIDTALNLVHSAYSMLSMTRKAWAGNTCLEKELHHSTLFYQVIQAILNAQGLIKQEVLKLLSA